LPSPTTIRFGLRCQTDPLASPRGQGQFLQVVGKLKPGVSLDQATVDLVTIPSVSPPSTRRRTKALPATVRSFVDQYIGNEPRQLLYTMLGAVFFVLLIACANVANLLLDRAAHRTKEVGIRTALGASRAHVVRQFLAEALVLSMIAALLGVGVAYLGISAFNRAITVHAGSLLHRHPAASPGAAVHDRRCDSDDARFRRHPALQSSRADINEILKDESRGASSFRIGRITRGLVMFEIALSCGLLVAAGLTIKA
jgi:hypothetical protein